MSDGIRDNGSRLYPFLFLYEPKHIFTHQRFRFACASAQSGQNLPWAHFGLLRMQAFFMRTMKSDQKSTEGWWVFQPFLLARYFMFYFNSAPNYIYRFPVNSYSSQLVLISVNSYSSIWSICTHLVHSYSLFGQFVLILVNSYSLFGQFVLILVNSSSFWATYSCFWSFSGTSILEYMHR